jgi:N-acetylneuraminate synthase
MNNFLKIGNSKIGKDFPTYFIADIAANHDGDLERAKKLILLAKESGADAVKFQHHDVTKYVSDYGFKSLGNKFSHQTKWEKSIFEVYKDAEVPKSWTQELKDYCEKINIDFFSTPYDLDMVDYLNQFVPAFKIGSGDVAWEEMLVKIAKTGKPVLFATGASTISEVIRAVEVISQYNNSIILMQCNTNYTASLENFKYINLNVLNTYKVLFPDIILGLSDHTPGCVTTLGAVALGARVIEKHFTDDINRKGPDHLFSMDPQTWREMVENTKLIEASLGSSLKKVEDNEKETVILQRRSIRVTNNLNVGDEINRELMQFQRPCPIDAIQPNEFNKLIGKKVIKKVEKGDYLRLEHFNW